MKKIFLLPCLLFSSMMISSCQNEEQTCLRSVSTLREIELNKDKDINLELACDIHDNEVISVEIYQNKNFIGLETTANPDNSSISFHFDSMNAKKEGLVTGEAILVITRANVNASPNPFQGLLRPIQIPLYIMLK